MIRIKLTLGLLALAGSAVGGWFAAPYWQGNASVRSAARLLFRSAADNGNGVSDAAALTLNGCSLSLADLRDADSLRALLTKLRDAAFSATPHDAEAFVSALMDQLSQLSPGDLRSLAIDLARDESLRKLMDETTRAIGLRMLSKDMERHLLLTVAKIVQRDPDRMLLLAEALPESETKKEFLSRTLMVLALERPMEVLALLNGDPPPLADGPGRREATLSALYTLAARSLPEGMAAWASLPEGRMKNQAATVFLSRVNDAPDEVFAWIQTQPDELRKQLTFASMEKLTPENARHWLNSPAAAQSDGAAYLQACGRLAQTDPAAALRLIGKGPAVESGDAGAAWWAGMAVQNIPMSDLLAAAPSMDAALLDQLLPGAFLRQNRTVEEFRLSVSQVADPELQAKLGEAWARSRWGNGAAGAEEIATFPPGPAREAALADLTRDWSRRQPDEWLEWVRSASLEDQNAAVSKADPKVWAKPENAAFLTSRPAGEQLPLLANIYREDAAAAAGVIERASAEGASAESLDKAAQSLAESWRDRDPATARAFAQALADPVMADSVLSNLAAGSATTAAREAAAAAIQDPVTRRQAERSAALRALGIEKGVITTKAVTVRQ